LTFVGPEAPSAVAKYFVAAGSQKEMTTSFERIREPM
jgi:hypothetical protein